MYIPLEGFCGDGFIPKQYTSISLPPANSHGLIAEGSLRGIAARHVASLEKEWPQDRDVLQAFRVFDSEGVGFIKVTLLKRFLVQAQLDVEDGVREYRVTRSENFN